MNSFFADLGQRLTAAAAAKDRQLPVPALDQPMAAELLELARVVARGQERRFAPLACYLAGVAVGRIEAADPEASSTDVRDLVREVRVALERELPAETPAGPGAGTLSGR
ncbi:MAG: DUF6457 domain-containing protein [Candidatus Limnocylindria bacterium]